MSHYIHDIAGRLRVRTPLIKRSPQKASEVEGLLRQITGITSIEITTVTGSIVINYDPVVVSSKLILDVLKQAGYVDLSKAITNDQYIHSAISKAGKVIGKKAFGFFIDKALAGTAVALIAELL